MSEQNRRYMERYRNSEHGKAVRAAWLAKTAGTPEHKAKRSKRAQKYYASAEGKAYKFKQRLAAYGLSPEQYEDMASRQSYCCAICLHDDPRDNWSSRLSVDHDHVSGKVRGLLCAQCNQGLGKFLDSPNLLKRAATYLQEHSNG